jgi:hypothetical protein
MMNDSEANDSIACYGGDGFILMGAGISKVALGLAAEVQIKIEVGLHRINRKKSRVRKISR